MKLNAKQQEIKDRVLGEEKEELEARLKEINEKLNTEKGLWQK